MFLNLVTNEISVSAPWGNTTLDESIISTKYKDWKEYSSLEEIKKTKEFLNIEKINFLNKLKENRNLIENSDIEYNNKYYQLDSKSVQRIIFMIDYMKAKSIDNIEWKTSNNESVTLTIEDLNNIILLAAERTNNLHIYYNELKDKINKTNSISDLYNIDIEFINYNN